MFRPWIHCEVPSLDFLWSRKHPFKSCFDTTFNQCRPIFAFRHQLPVMMLLMTIFHSLCHSCSNVFMLLFVDKNVFSVFVIARVFKFSRNICFSMFVSNSSSILGAWPWSIPRLRLLTVTTNASWLHIHQPIHQPRPPHNFAVDLENLFSKF